MKNNVSTCRPRYVAPFMVVRRLRRILKNFPLGAGSIRPAPQHDLAFSIASSAQSFWSASVRNEPRLGVIVNTVLAYRCASARYIGAPNSKHKVVSGCFVCVCFWFQETSPSLLLFG